jgi:hypothetical protein
MRFSMKERTRTHPGSRTSLSKAQESQHTVLTSNDDLLQILLNIRITPATDFGLGLGLGNNFDGLRDVL